MGGGGEQSQSPATAEEQYVKAKISVWWDIENCHVPKVCDSHMIAQNISSALVKLNYCGPVSISAYGDTTNISPSVQKALNSTGIALNHVPAGVKDASDKKILVDMLFWAVDNPAPANYLLISGDRDFSNALHQLRMRRYNILLAQPQKASAVLVTAAKSVWLWSSLSAGGSTLTNSESAQFLNDSYGYVSTSSDSSTLTDSSQTHQPTDSFHKSPHLGNQKFSNMGRGTDIKNKGKPNRRNITQPSMPRTSSSMSVTEGNYKNPSFIQMTNERPNPFIVPQDFSGPYDPKISVGGTGPTFAPGNFDSSWANSIHPHGSHQNQPHPARANSVPVEPILTPVTSSTTSQHPPYIMPQWPEAPYLASGPPTYMPDVANLSISELISNSNAPATQPKNAGDRKESFIEAPNRSSPKDSQKGYGQKKAQTSRFPQAIQEIPPPLSSTSGITNITSSNEVQGTPGCPKPTKRIQSLIGVVLLALDTLKDEKIMPTEENITDCIRYGDTRHRPNDVKKALACALEQQLVVLQQLGDLQLYIGKNKKLWHCVNPMGGNAKQYPKTTWDKIQKFLSSSPGRCAVLDTQCRYEVATIVKKMCLNDLSMGEILQILHMVINIKKWIILNNKSGWKPIKITLAEINPDSGWEAAT